MKKTFKITVNTTSKEFKEAYTEVCKKIDASLGAFYLFNFTVRELVFNRIEKFLKKKNEDYGGLLVPIDPGDLFDVLVHMADWIKEDVIKSFDLEFKATIEFKDGACWAATGDFCLLDFPELKEGFVAKYSAFEALPVKE